MITVAEPKNNGMTERFAMGTDTSENDSAASGAGGVSLESFIDLVRSRRSTRHFRPDPVPPVLLDKLLEASRWAPSGFNLQPTHFVVVTDADVKAKLYPACMKQRQVLEAGATVVFTGDRRVVANHFERVLQQDREAGAINAAYEQLLRKSVPLSFNQGPLGVGWFWKAVAEAVAGRFVPIPSVQAVHKNFWLAKQVCLSAMVFLLAAEVAGLATCPMEGFGEHAVRRALGIPSTQAVVLLVAVGYADKSGLKKTRLPLDGRVHRDRW
jgi:nitroreductase